MMKLNDFIAVLLFVWSSLVLAADPELRLLSEHPVDGMRGGNLSGLAQCGEHLWTVSDRDDDRMYRLDTRDRVWKAEPVMIDVPPVPDDPGRSLAMKTRSFLRSVVGNGALDFEGISCDDSGNLYILSETYSAVLKVTPNKKMYWLIIAPAVLSDSRKGGLLLEPNALFEGLAVSRAGFGMWLAAERQNRGVVYIAQFNGDAWRCPMICVLLSEGGLAPQPPQFPGSRWVEMDFSDIALFNRKLFLLDRNAFKVCRHSLVLAIKERCWSFAEDALKPHRQYPSKHGLTEALWIDDEGAWIGVDNNSDRRADGEVRPIVWRFAAPAGGWDAAP